MANPLYSRTKHQVSCLFSDGDCIDAELGERVRIVHTNSYYAELTNYVNAHSGLEALTPEQVKSIVQETNRLKRVTDPKETKMPTSKRADLGKILPAVRCTARKRNGQPCKAMAARGANVCRVHGGSAPQVKHAAQRRLQQAADVLTERLLGFALDSGVPDAIALAAVRDALDRAGLKPGVEVEVTARPYQTILENLGALEGGSRAEWRRSQGIADEPTTALVVPQSPDEPLDVELVDDYEPSDDGLCATDSDQHPHGGESGPDAFIDSSGDETGPNPFATSPPGTELVPITDAVSQAAELRRRTQHAPGHGVVRRSAR